MIEIVKEIRNRTGLKGLLAIGAALLMMLALIFIQIIGVFNDSSLSRDGFKLYAFSTRNKSVFIGINGMDATYSVNGHTYLANLYYVPWLEQYSNGESIRILYDPNNPAIISTDQPLWKRLSYRIFIICFAGGLFGYCTFMILKFTITRTAAPPVNSE